MLLIGLFAIGMAAGLSADMALARWRKKRFYASGKCDWKKIIVGQYCDFYLTECGHRVSVDTWKYQQSMPQWCEHCGKAIEVLA